MMKSPFKFLDAYTKEDRDIFFGREKEIEELYHRVFDSRIMLVYGESGTGKSSLVQCGLANKFRDTDWLPLMIRRGENMPDSIARAVKTAAITPLEYELLTTAMFKKAIRSLYIDYYKPIFFIFDQFEELFIFGTKEEKQSLVHLIHALTESDIECRFIFIMREEYFASVTEFEKFIPGFLSNRIRIEKMPLANALSAINGPCGVYDIEVEDGFAGKLLKKLNPDTPNVELTWLQVFLDKIFNLAVSEAEKEKDKPGSLSFTNSLLEKTGDVSDLLGSFLDDRIAMMGDQEAALAVLKSFVSVKGTRRQLSAEEAKENAHTLGKPIDEPALLEMIQTFVNLRILRDKDQYGKYELRHDSLAKKIFEKFTIIEKELLEIRQFIDIAWNSWQKRKVMISADDLGYIAPYESRLHLSKEIGELIEKSKKELIRKKHLRRNLAGSFGIALILVLSAFSVWALRERNRAQGLRIKALAENYNYRAKEVAVYDPTKGLRLAESAFSLDTANITIQENIRDIYTENNFYSIVVKHDNPILAVAYSPDNSTIATGSADGTTILWDLNGKIIRQIKGYGNPVKSVAFSPDGKKILTGNGEIISLRTDTKAYLWDLDGNIVKSFIGHTSDVNSVSFSPDGNNILTGSSDGTVRFWDLNGNTIKIFKRGNLIGNPTPVAFSPDGRKIITSSADATTVLLALLDIQGNELKVFSGHTNNIDALAFSPDGQRILTGSRDNTAILWNLSGKIEKVYRCTNRVRSVAFSPDGLKILTGTIGGSVQLWDLDGNEIQSFKGHNDAINSAVFSLDGRKILTGSTDKTARLWDLPETNKIVYRGHVGPIYCIDYSSVSQKIITGSGDKTVRIWNLNGKLISTYICTEGSRISDLAFSHDGGMFITGAWGDNSLRLWDMQGNKLRNFKGHTLASYSVSYAPDGKKILTGSVDNTARLWDLDGNEIRVFKGHSSWLYTVAFSPDGKNILTGSGDKTVRLWDLDGKTIATFRGHTGAVRSVRFSPDGNRILTGSDDQTARLWDLKGKQLKVFIGHTGSVFSVAFSPDGNYILTGSNDQTARLWDLQGEITQIFRGAEGGIQDVLFLPDGKTILTASSDNLARLYPVKIPYQTFKETGGYEKLSAGDKLNFGIYQYDDIIRSGSEIELMEVADYYSERAAKQGMDEKTKSIDYASELYKILEKNAPENIHYVLKLLGVSIHSYVLNPAEKTKKEIERINQKVLNFKSLDDLFLIASFYNGLSNSTDSTINKLYIEGSLFKLIDKIISYPDAEEEIKKYFVNLRDLSWSILLKGQYKTALNGLQISWAADSADLITIGAISMAYILNDQYYKAKRILEERRNKTLHNYPPSMLENASFRTYADFILYLLINSVETRAITHPDFAKAKELLRKK